MSAVREWAAGVCLAVLAAALLQYFTPSGAMERVYRLVLSAFALLCLIAPFSSLLRSDFSAELRAFRDGTAGEAFSSFVDTQVIDALGQNLESLVALELNKIGAKYENVSVMTDTGEDGRIVINRIVVTLPMEDADKCSTAKARISAALGIETEVTVHGAGE